MLDKLIDYIFYNPFGENEKWKQSVNTSQLIALILEKIRVSEKNDIAKFIIQKLQETLVVRLGDMQLSAVENKENNSCGDNVNGDALLNKEEMEILAEKVHEAWLKVHAKEGWTYGSVRNDDIKRAPSFVEYCKLSEQDKEYDRVTVAATLDTLPEMGFEIIKKRVDKEI